MEKLFRNYELVKQTDAKPVILGSKGTLALMRPSNPKFINRFENKEYGYVEIIETDDYYAVAFPLKSKSETNGDCIFLSNITLEDLLSTDVDIESFVKFKPNSMTK